MPPKPTPTPVPGETPTGDGETAAEMAAKLAAGGSGTFGREELRKLFADLGWDVSVPATLPDLEDVGKELRTTMDQLTLAENRLAAGYDTSGGLFSNITGTLGRAVNQVQVSGLRQKVTSLTDALYSYAGDVFGSAGQTIVSRTLRPPIPDVTKLPTAEEFLGGFEEAYATHIEGLKKNGGLTNEEAQFAYDAMRNETYQKYMAKLGEFAKSGISPFIQKEVSREERGIGAGTAAGAALDKALGPGVTEPTTVTGTGEEVSAAMDKAGQGVPKEFTTAARLSPLDFLSEALSPSDIKVKYAGSPEGALKSIRGAPAGYTANPRRV